MAQSWAVSSIFQLLPTAAEMASFAQPSMLQAQAPNYAIDSGSVNTIVAEFNPALTAPVPGAPLRVLIAHTNTGPATLNAGDGAHPIHTQAGAALAGGELVINSIPEFIWNSAVSAYQVFIGAGGGGGGNTWPLTPPPMSFPAKLAADAAAGVFTDWVWGPVVLTAPVLINLTQNVNYIGFDMHGSSITCAFNDPTSSMIKYFCPNSNPFNTNVSGLNIRNAILFGNGTCLNGIELSSPLGNSGIYGGNCFNVHVVGCAGNGFQCYGSVFEHTFLECFAADNMTGLEMRNPTAGGGAGVISSIKIIGGDYRANTQYGISSQADTSFQEAVGFHVAFVDLIANGYPGILGGSGIQLVIGTHLERNCTSASTPSHGAIWTFGGPVTLINVDVADNNGDTLYSADISSANQNQLTSFTGVGANDEGSGHGMKVGKLGGAGRLVCDYQAAFGGISSNFDGNTNWITESPNFTQGTI